MQFRGDPVEKSYIGPLIALANAREISSDLTAAYVDGKLDRVEAIYNRYVSPLTQYVAPDAAAGPAGGGLRRGSARRCARRTGREPAEDETRALWDYEPDPEELLLDLFSEYVDLSCFAPCSSRPRRSTARG